MRIESLKTLNALIAFDFDNARYSGGGTRYASDVTKHEASLLARAMTYKFGAIGLPAGGAKGVVRGKPAERNELMRRYCEEIRQLVESGQFGTGPDLGTCEADFAPLRDQSQPPSVMAGNIGGVPIEDVITGFGVVIAVETARGSLEDSTFAIEGFGKVGGGVAREAVRRGARVVAVSTLEGCVFDPSGLDVELMLGLRREHGDAVVRHVGGDFSSSPASLWDAQADILVPGARTGVITPKVAERLRIPWIAPAANAPYVREALEVLRQRRIRYLPDFVCNAGATIGYTSRPGDSGELFRVVEDKISSLMGEASADPRGPFEGACAIAERYIETWRGPEGMPEGPPLA
ncbi:MAG: Glu/Leu/Phe/Val dehydrogenase dimerization domain-containing protein [Actinomycetota bacterium]